MRSLLNILAQAGGEGTGQPAGEPTAPPGGFGGNLFFGLMLALIVFYIFMFRGQGRKRKETEKMIQNLRKNDRVVTIGGIVGTVVATKGDEVVLRVDESSNIKMTFVRQSIQRTVSNDPQPAKG